VLRKDHREHQRQAEKADVPAFCKRRKPLFAQEVPAALGIRDAVGANCDQRNENQTEAVRFDIRTRLGIEITVAEHAEADSVNRHQDRLAFHRLQVRKPFA
jgi:hypothetical protein